MARDRGELLHNPIGMKGRPTTEAIKRFLGRVNRPNLFFAAALAVAARNTTQEGLAHYKWLAGVREELGIEQVKTTQFLGKCIEFTGSQNEKGYGRFDAMVRSPQGKFLNPMGVYKKGKLLKGRAGRRKVARRLKKKYVRVHWAHRFAFMVANGYLPEEHVGHDHSRSHSVACVNPFHLRPESLLANVKESNDRRRVSQELGQRKHVAAKRPPEKTPGRRREEQVEVTADTVAGIPF